MSSSIYKILGVPFSNISFCEFIKIIQFELEGDNSIILALSNPEFLLEARKNSILFDYLNSVNFNLADGVGILFSSRLLFKKPFPERITGTDFLPELIKIGYDKYRFFFLGGLPGVAETAAENFRIQYGGRLSIDSFHGYFKIEEEHQIIERINSFRADIIMVCLGNPRQEEFILRNKNKLKYKLIFGNGGALDFWANKVRRAPMWMQDLGLEWLFRLYQDPSLIRLKRQLNLIKFPFLVFNQFKNQGFMKI